MQKSAKNLGKKRGGFPPEELVPIPATVCPGDKKRCEGFSPKLFGVKWHPLKLFFLQCSLLRVPIQTLTGANYSNFSNVGVTIFL